MMSLTNLEAQIQSLLGFYTRRGYNGSVTTDITYVPLSSTSVPAQLVYVSNTTGKTLNVSTDNGITFLALPDGAIFPFNNIGDLRGVWIKTDDNSTGLTVTFRYEV